MDFLRIDAKEKTLNNCQKNWKVYSKKIEIDKD